jgi:hemerythrin-like metal-binding protein
MIETSPTSLLEKQAPPQVPFRVFAGRFLFYTMIILSVFIVIGVAVFRIQTSLETKENSAKNKSAIEIAANLAKHDFETVIGDLLFLANDDTAKGFLAGNNIENSIIEMQNEFLNLSNTRQLYDQIRLIGPSGNELVRVNFANGESTFEVPENLQNKFNRYYFSATSLLAKGEYYISPIDLNIENSEIEFPHKPMIRFGTPLFDSSGILRGVIVINYLGQGFLDKFKKQMELVPGTGMLLNSDGFWLSSPDAEDEWSFMFGGEANFGKKYPKAWKTIKKDQTGVVETTKGTFSFTTVNPSTKKNQTPAMAKQLEDWKIITVSFDEQIDFSSIKSRLLNYFPFLGILPIAMFIGLFLARSTVRRKLAELKLAEANSSLEEKISIRTHELGERVKEQTGLYSLARILNRLDITIEEALELAVEVLPPAWHYPDITCARITYDEREFTTTNFVKTNWCQTATINHQGKGVGEIGVYYLEETPELDEGPFLKEERNLINSMSTNIEIYLSRKFTEEGLQSALKEAEKAKKEAEKAKKEAEKSSKVKSEFLASMSHELRTPLNAVIGFAQMMQFDPKAPLAESQIEHVGSILEGGNHLLNLVNGILDLAKIEAGEVSLFVEDVNANEVIADCVELIKPLGKPTQLEIINKIDAKSLSLIRTDRMRLKQIVLNLLSNAVKYNKVSGKVTIEGWETDDKFLHISVIDTGIGVSIQNQKAIFGMYYRFENDAYEAKDGTGIGLTVSKLLVEQMAGRIGLLSEEDVGSTFWIELPLSTNEETMIWTDALRVGVDAIDKDHQVLISLLNKITDRSIADEDIDDIIGELIDYTNYHFQREEAIMEVCQYNDLENHREIHRNLIAKVNDMATAWHMDNSDQQRIKLHKFLRDWLFTHIISEDTKLAAGTKGRGRVIQQALNEIE